MGDCESLKQGLKNIIPHAFEEHTCCNVSWCGFKQNPVAYKHTDLPNGKDLFGDSLKIALHDILDEYSTDIVVNKLTPRANSQTNENEYRAESQELHLQLLGLGILKSTSVGC